MPPLNILISPTGQTINSTAADQLAQIAALRAGALTTPISNEWDEQDMATYLWHLDETEAQLREGITP